VALQSACVVASRDRAAFAHTRELPVAVAPASMQSLRIALTAHRRGRPRHSSTWSSAVWGLSTQHARALPPGLVASLPRAVTQGLLSRPAWEVSLDTRDVKSFMEAHASPRDGYILDLALRTTMAEEGRGDGDMGGKPGPAAGAVPYDPLASSHLRPFLAAATEVFLSLFRDGPPRTSAALEAAEEVCHPDIVAAFKRAAAAAPGDAPATVVTGVTAAQIVDGWFLWDGTLYARDTPRLDERCEAQQLGHSISLSTASEQLGLITRLLSQWMHFHQLQPLRRLVARVTVAFVCQESVGGVETGEPFKPLPVVDLGKRVASEWDGETAGEPPSRRRRGGAAHRRSGDTSPAAAARGFGGSATHDPQSLSQLVGVPVMAALLEQKGSPLPTSLLHVTGASVHAVCGATGEAWGMERDTLPQPPPPPAAAPPPSTEDAPAAKRTVHTVTFECVVASSQDPAFKPMAYFRSPTVFAEQLWRVVDVDGKWPGQRLTFVPGDVVADAAAQARRSAQFAMDRLNVRIPEMEKVCAAVSAGSASCVQAIEGVLKAGATSPAAAGVLDTPIAASSVSHRDALIATRFLLSSVAALLQEAASGNGTASWRARWQLEQALEGTGSPAAVRSDNKVASPPLSASPRLLAAMNAPWTVFPRGASVAAGKHVILPRADMRCIAWAFAMLVAAFPDVGADAAITQVAQVDRFFTQHGEFAASSLMADILYRTAVPLAAACAFSAIDHIAGRGDLGARATAAESTLPPNIVALRDSLGTTALPSLVSPLIATILSNAVDMAAGKDRSRADGKHDRAGDEHSEDAAALAELVGQRTQPLAQVADIMRAVADMMLEKG